MSVQTHDRCAGYIPQRKGRCLMTQHDVFPMVIRSGAAAKEVVRLIRARRLLVAAVDDHRTIVGGVSSLLLG